MASITRRGSKLYLDFRYQGVRCREATGLADTPANKKRLRALLGRLEAEITLGTFDYAAYFPNSKHAVRFRNAAISTANRKQGAPLFADFAKAWFDEKRIEWRESTQESAGCALQKYLLPYFGDKALDQITKTDILQFRKQMADPDGTGQLAISASRINHVMSALKMIIEEGADRYGFESPWRNIKRLRGTTKDVLPFTLPEVMRMINTVRPDYRNYLTVRFFTGMRTAEIDGLQWQDVDLDRREINVRQGWVMGKFVPTKTDGSRRTIIMSSLVHQA